MPGKITKFIFKLCEKIDSISFSKKYLKRCMIILEEM